MRTNDRRTAQGLLEYVILVVLIALAVLISVRAFGDRVRIKFLSSESALVSGIAVDPSDSDSDGDGNRAESEEEEENPYIWDDDAQRWFDPETNRFVSFAEAGRFVDNPFEFRDRSREPGRNR